jgi:cytochrome c553
MDIFFLIKTTDGLSSRIKFYLTTFATSHFLSFFPLLIISTIALGCGPKIRYLNDANSTIYSNEVLSKEAQRGRKIFNSSGKCWKCHGLDADDHTKLFLLRPELNPQPTNLRNYNELKYTRDKELREVIMNGIQGPSMVERILPKVNLTDAELRALIAYLKEIRIEKM